MSNAPSVALVFVTQGINGSVLIYTQKKIRGKRIGPFLSSKDHAKSLVYLDERDKHFYKLTKMCHLIDDRELNSDYKYFPEIVNYIAGHEYFCVKMPGNRSIRFATKDERNAMRNTHCRDKYTSVGKIDKAQLDILDDGGFKLYFLYDNALRPIPFCFYLEQSQTIVLKDGEVVSRDAIAETSMLKQLEVLFERSLDVIASDVDYSLDLSKLANLNKEKWEILHKGVATSTSAARFDSSGIAWFESGREGALEKIDYGIVAAAYLKGRGRIEIDGNLVFFPPINDDRITSLVALRVAAEGAADIPFDKILKIKKRFEPKDVGRVQEELLHAGFLGKLKKYQSEGVLWLSSIYDENLGGILADEMGLGKTVQVLAFIAKKNIGRTIVVSPASVIPNWTIEIEKFFPSIKRLTTPLGFDLSTNKPQICIISYQKILRLINEVRQFDLDLLVLDEGQFVKNFDTKTAQALRVIDARMRLVMTGTPIENSLNDLWSHLKFCDNSFSLAHKRLSIRFPGFGRSVLATELSAKAFGSLILRRTKDDVGIDLPPVIEEVVFCEMHKAQRDLYLTTLGAFRTMLRSGIASRVNSIALEALLRLRQCCSHTILLPDSLNSRGISESIKFHVALDIIQDNIIDNKKTIVFLQFRMVLDAMENELIKRGIGVVRLDGETIDRDTPVNNFQNRLDINVILIGFRSGGVGINLTSAESVILFDPWWNPAAESQAFARAHRIGQSKTVFVFKLICSDTIEEKMLQLLVQKSMVSNSLSLLSKEINPVDYLDIFL